MRGIGIAAGVLGLTSGIASAADVIEWDDPSGGVFDVASNWAGGQTPGPDDTAWFALDATYTVFFNDPLTRSGGTLVSDGRVSFLGDYVGVPDDAFVYATEGPLRLSGGSGLTLGQNDDLSISVGLIELVTNDFAAVQLGSRLDVLRGSGFTSNQLLIGTASGGGGPDNGTVIVDGWDGLTTQRSFLKVAKDVVIGRAGGGGSLTIRDGAEATIGGSLLIDDSSDAPGSSGLVRVETGASLAVGNIEIGTGGASTFTSALFVSGEDTTVTQHAASTLAIGAKAENLGQLVVRGGAAFTTGGGATLVSPTGRIIVGWDGASEATASYFARGDIEIAHGGEFRVADNGEAHLLVGRTLSTRNANAIQLTGGVLHVNGATIRTPQINFGGGALNFNYGTLAFTGDLTMSQQHARDLLGYFPEIGSLRTVTVAGDTTLETPLLLSGGTFSTGTLTNAWLLDFQSGTLALTGTELTLGAGGLFGDTLELAATQRLEVGPSVAVGADGRLALDGGRLIVDKLVNDGEILLADPRSRIDGATLSNAGLVRGGGLVTTAAVTNLASGELRVDDGESVRLAGTLANLGRVDVIGGELEVDGAATNGRGAVTRPVPSPALPGEIFARDAVLRFDGGFTNAAGTLGFSFGTSDVFGAITNHTSATVAVSGGANVTFYDDVVNGGEFRVSEGATAVFFGDVSGSGAFTGGGTSFFEGAVSPGSSPGVMAFEGDVVLGELATLVIELGGIVPGLEHDRLVVAQHLDLDGRLRVVLLDSFAPSLGDRFEILGFDTGRLSGAFAAVDLPELAGGLSWDAAELYTAGTLTVVPEPASLALLGLAAAVVTATRRR